MQNAPHEMGTRVPVVANQVTFQSINKAFTIMSAVSCYSILVNLINVVFKAYQLFEFLIQFSFACGESFKVITVVRFGRL